MIIRYGHPPNSPLLSGALIVGRQKQIDSSEMDPMAPAALALEQALQAKLAEANGETAQSLPSASTTPKQSGNR